MSRNMNRCSQRRTTVTRDQGRPLGLATLRRSLELTGRARVSRPCREPAESVAASMRDAHAHKRSAQRNLLTPYGGVRAQLQQIHRVS